METRIGVVRQGLAHGDGDVAFTPWHRFEVAPGRGGGFCQGVEDFRSRLDTGRPSQRHGRREPDGGLLGRPDSVGEETEGLAPSDFQRLERTQCQNQGRSNQGLLLGLNPRDEFRNNLFSPPRAMGQGVNRPDPDFGITIEQPLQISRHTGLDGHICRENPTSLTNTPCFVIRLLLLGTSTHPHLLKSAGVDLDVRLTLSDVSKKVKDLMLPRDVPVFQQLDQEGDCDRRGLVDRSLVPDRANQGTERFLSLRPVRRGQSAEEAGYVRCFSEGVGQPCPVHFVETLQHLAPPRESGWRRRSPCVELAHPRSATLRAIVSRSTMTARSPAART